MWESLWEKMKATRKLPPKEHLLLLLLAGILLLVLSAPPSGFGTVKVQERKTGRGKKQEEDLPRYGEYLERRVGNALAQVEGVGKTRVMITMKSTGQRMVEKDQDVNDRTLTEESEEAGKRTSQEQTSGKVSVYEHGSDGSQKPYINKEMMPEIEGVLVIAEGGGNPVVVKSITEAIQALFGLEAHKIKIMKKAGN